MPKHLRRAAGPDFYKTEVINYIVHALYVAIATQFSVLQFLVLMATTHCEEFTLQCIPVVAVRLSNQIFRVVLFSSGNYFIAKHFFKKICVIILSPQIDDAIFIHSFLTLSQCGSFLINVFVCTDNWNQLTRSIILRRRNEVMGVFATIKIWFGDLCIHYTSTPTRCRISTV